MEDGEAFKGAEFLGYLIKGMAEGVLFIDGDNITRLCNPVGGSIRGVEREDIVGRPFLECHPPAVIEKVLKVVSDLKKGKENEVSRIVKLKGRMYEHTYSAVRNKKGEFLGVVAVSRDVTERLKLENALKEHAQKLEYSNHMKDLFADIMSHDFINPAAIVKNYAELLLEEDLPDEVAEDIETIERSATRLIDMVENASKFSRLEDAESLPLKESDVGELLESAIEDYEPFVKEKKITVKYNPKGRYVAEVSPFIGDVFTNLISNAIKYSGENTTIEISVKDQGKSLLIAVADEAEKIPEEYRKTIFNRFKRLSKGGVKGSGLGLAIVKRIVDLHHGSVRVEDNPKGGNIFYVEIPKKGKYVKFPEINQSP